MQHEKCCSTEDDSFISTNRQRARLRCLVTKRRSRSSSTFVVAVSVLTLIALFSLRSKQVENPTSFFSLEEEESSSSLSPLPSLSETSDMNDDDDHDRYHFDASMFSSAALASTPPLPLPVARMTRPQQVFYRYIQQHSVHRLREENATTISNIGNNMIMKRRFSVAHYACPQQAGNRLHQFVNDLMLAMLTNRTVLVRYWNDEACRQVGSAYDVDTCDKRKQLLEQQQSNQQQQQSNANTSSASLECDGILRLAPWLALYDDWMPQFQKEYRQQQQRSQSSASYDSSSPFSLSPPPPPLVTGLTIRGKAKGDFLPWSTTQRTGPTHDMPVVVYRPLVGVQRANFAQLFFPLMDLSSNKTDQKYEQQRQEERHADIQAIASELFSLGADYFFGMLFHESFSFTPDFVESTDVLVHDPPYYQPRQQRLVDLLQQQQQQHQQSDHVNNGTILSIALHSRHVDSLDDGSNVTHETACLEKLLLQQSQSSPDDVVAGANHLGENDRKNNNGTGIIGQGDCLIFLLSDRPRTVFWIKAWLAKNAVQHYHCTVITAAHAKHEGADDGKDMKGLEVEHGPFAGAGFYRDLLFASSLSSSSSSSFSKTAWIGHDRRSSSKLLLEWMEYQRDQNIKRNDGENVGRSISNGDNDSDGDPDALPDISQCRLPEEKPETKKKKK